MSTVIEAILGLGRGAATLVCNHTATKVPTQHQESGSPPAEPITAYYPTIQSRQYKKATIISEKLTL